MLAKIVKTLPTPSAGQKVAFLPDGLKLATGDLTNGVTIWDIATWQAERVLKVHDVPQSLAISKHNNVLAVGTAFGMKVQLWNTQSWKQSKDLSGHHQEVRSVSLDDAGRLVASGGFDGLLIVWDVAKRRRVFLYKTNEIRTNPVALSPDGKWLAAVIGDQVIIWETERWRIVHQIGYANQGFDAIAFSPNSDRFVCSSAGIGIDPLVHIIHCPSWQTLHILRGYTIIPEFLCFSHDGKILASADVHGMIKFWSTESGTLLLTTTQPQKSPTSLAFHPTQYLLAAGYNDGAVTISLIRE